MNRLNDYEPVIGMEIHAEMHTHSKMFCGCAVTDTAVAELNTLVCPVCTGLPGAMPVVNREAVEQAMMVGLALNCQINAFTNFARKNYFYPDLPKGYQISQYDFPIATDGWVDVVDENGAAHHIRVRRAHMEEDTAKLFHIYEPGGGDYTLIDFNRCGVPLLEIVSEPDMHSVEAVQAYATKIREILRYLGVNSGDMEKGVLRFEANVSVRPRGSETLGTRTEIKNLNSFRALTLATAYEIERQIGVIEAGGEVVQETLGWDALRNVTFSQRSKEQAHDYRYFPEPDLPPLSIARPWVDEVAAALPELPDAKHARFVADYGLTAQDARILVGERAVAGYFERAIRAYRGAPSSVAKWLIGELFYLMNRDNVAIDIIRVQPEALARLIGLVDAGTLNPNSAKAVLGEMFATGNPPEAIVEAKGLAQIADDERLAAVVAQVLADNAAQVAAYRAGKDSVFQWLMGQVMRATRGRAAPDVTRRLLSHALTMSENNEALRRA
ncbi:MAG TPA: Asp-tRNA(Asn)/Glu-tRNA(Gln) amidotransferase subunit GatB [Anaerolineae bacterium]|nr:Asp-tRNA(Asn)/Glu-tRNA(Gln) amidotransferase subunit GatB [Anaerolineae bacterium]